MLLSFWHILPKYVELRQNGFPILGVSPTADQVAMAEVVLSRRLRFYHCIIHHYSEQMLLDLCQNALNSSEWHPYETIYPTDNLVYYVVLFSCVFKTVIAYKSKILGNAATTTTVIKTLSE